MRKRWRKLRKWSLMSSILFLLFLLVHNVQAYTIESRVWPAANTTYRRDGSYDGQGQAWIDRLNTADAEWAGVFQFNLDNNSLNVVRAVNLGAGGVYAQVIPFFSVGPYRIGFTLDVTNSCYAG